VASTNVAQSFAAAQFVAVIPASSWLLSERIGTSQWVGITLIAVGILIVGWSRKPIYVDKAFVACPGMNRIP
jgi:drug/metabolite transporter (DMT)-like permease